MNIDLPSNLEKEYNEINYHFDVIRGDWQYYNDELLSEDKVFVKRILTFIIDVIDYAIENYDKIDVQKYRDFLGFYYAKFYYGPHGDDNNYLDLDETIDGQPISEYCWELRDDAFVLTKKISNRNEKKVCVG